MSLKRTIRVLIVGLLACIFGVFIVSCKEQSRTIVGFSVEEEISVQYQDTYYIARPTVKDGQDNPLDVEVTVVDSFQSVVPLVADGFVVEDMAGYKIIYTVYFNSECYTKTTVVNVNRKGEIELSFSQTDKFMTVEKETSVAEVEYEHFVPVTIEYYYQNAEEEVKIENGVFTPKMTGYYSVIAKAQDEYGNRGSAYYRLYCQRASEKGEVEIYDAEREFLVKEGLMEEPRGYVYVDTDETGIYDHLGRKANFAKIETTDEFINFSLLPKMTKKYYNTLAEEGFEYISLWVYIDGGENAYNFYRKMGISGYLQTGIGTYGANDWIELRLNLQDENNDYLRSFLSAYDEICSRTVMPFFMHNQQREKLTVYIEDVYAVKPVSEEEFILSEIEEKTLGEYISLTEYVDSDYEWYCQATVNGSSFIMDNEDFLLTENGEYTLSFLAKEKAYYIDKTVKFKVNNPYTFYALSLIKNQTNGFEKIPFAELQASFSNGETTVDSSEISYSVSYLGKNFDCDELGFMPDRIGGYTITATATVAVGENEYVLKENCVVDVYTEQSKFDLFTVDSRATEFSYVYKNHAWDVLPKSYVYTGSVGETADTYYVMDTNSLLGSGLQTMYVNFGFIPTYSLNYYTELLNDNPDMVLDFNLYFEDLSGKTDANSQPFPKAYWDYKAGYVFGVKVDTWQEYKTLFTLKDLVNGYYEVFAEDGLNRLEGGKGKSLLVVNTDARRT